MEALIESDFNYIRNIINDYTFGLYHADVTKLKSIFHPETILQTPNNRRSLQQWLADVASRPIPREQGSSKDFNILSVDIVKDQAMVKLECPLFEHRYIDFLSLLKENGQWLIVNKMYTDCRDYFD